MDQKKSEMFHAEIHDLEYADTSLEENNIQDSVKDIVYPIYKKYLRVILQTQLARRHPKRRGYKHLRRKPQKI